MTRSSKSHTRPPWWGRKEHLREQWANVIWASNEYEVKKSNTTGSHRRHLANFVPSVTCQYCHKLRALQMQHPDVLDEIIRNWYWMHPFKRESYRATKPALKAALAWKLEQLSIAEKHGGSSPQQQRGYSLENITKKEIKRSEKQLIFRDKVISAGTPPQFPKGVGRKEPVETWDDELSKISDIDDSDYEEEADLRRRLLLEAPEGPDGTLDSDFTLGDVALFREDPGYEIRWKKPSRRQQRQRQRAMMSLHDIPDIPDMEFDAWDDWELASVLDVCSEFDHLEDELASLQSWEELETMSNLTI